MALSPRLLVAGCLLVALTTLQGCDVTAPLHEIANWRTHESYLYTYSYTAPLEQTLLLNSCSNGEFPETMQCSGHGYCESLWTLANGTYGPSFCVCNVEWAGPECAVHRQRQSVAFMYSLFLGFLGADQFYLGYWVFGLGKLFTLGGFGVWYLWDLVRLSNENILTTNFRLAADLPHWVAMCVLLPALLLVGMLLGLLSAYTSRYLKAYQIMHSVHETENEVREIRPLTAPQAPPPKPTSFIGRSFRLPPKTVYPVPNLRYDPPVPPTISFLPATREFPTGSSPMFGSVGSGSSTITGAGSNPSTFYLNNVVGASSPYGSMS